MWLIVLIFCCVIFYSHVIELNNIQISKLNIKIKNLNPEFEGLKIVHLTDLHGKKFLKGQNYFAKLINQQQADLIIITGDLIFHSNDFKDMLRLIKKLKAESGIYFCLGNHEYKLQIEKVVEELERINVKVLINESTIINKDSSNGLKLIGIDDYSEGEPISLENFTYNNNLPSILMSHSPDIADEAIKNNIDLVLSGHTHGGQICLPFFGAIFTACKNYWKKYESGYYKKGNTQIYVNRGIGYSLLPFRFFCPPEIATFNLTRNDKDGGENNG